MESEISPDPTPNKDFQVFYANISVETHYSVTFKTVHIHDIHMHAIYVMGISHEDTIDLVDRSLSCLMVPHCLGVLS